MRSEVEELALDRHAGLFEKFALRGCEQVFPFVRQTLGNRPGAKVLLRPERTAGMDEHYLQIRRSSSKQQNACADLRHPSEVMPPRLFAEGRHEQAAEFGWRVGPARELEGRAFAEIAGIDAGIGAGCANNAFRPIVGEPEIAPIDA